MGRGPVGPGPLVGRGSEDRRANDQRPRRDGSREALLPLGGHDPPLPDPGRRLLRVGHDRRRQAAPKQPHYIHFADGRAFAFAGLWERWRKGGGEPLDTCTIITTTPNDLVTELHDRMPVILPPDAFTEWLEPERLTSDRLQDLLAPYPAGEMEAYPVSTHVNKPVNNDPECVARVG